MNWREGALALNDNPGQKAAFDSEGNCAILAGPGSGKTRTITLKIARLLDEEVRAPQRIAVVTYSNGCVDEIRHRLDALGISDAGGAFVATVHGFCLTQIVMPFATLAGLSVPDPLSVASATQMKVLFARAVRDVRGSGAVEFGLDTKCSAFRLSTRDRSSRAWTQDHREVRRIVDAYEHRLLEAGVVDFDGMVLAGAALVEDFDWVRTAVRARFPVVVVDEYQDLGVPLHRMVLALMQRAGVRVIAVGDPDQSIYGFTGARPELLRELANQPRVHTVRLRRNYRCATRIELASRCMLQDEVGEGADGEGVIVLHRTGQDISGQAKLAVEDLVPRLLAENPGWVPGDIAILYRNLYEGRDIADAAEKAGLACYRSDRGAPVQRTALTNWMIEAARWCAGELGQTDITVSHLVRGLARVLHLSSGDPAVAGLREQLVGFLFRGRKAGMRLEIWLRGMNKLVLRSALAPETFNDERDCVDLLISKAREGDLSHFTVGSFARQGRDSDRVFLTTLYSAKGLEFNAVIMPGLEKGRVPDFRHDDDEIAEDRRLFYVGMTRARAEVHLLYNRTASPFVALVRDALRP
jgi:superfamily I DNA/RNA helicase